MSTKQNLLNSKCEQYVCDTDYDSEEYYFSDDSYQEENIANNNNKPTTKINNSTENVIFCNEKNNKKQIVCNWIFEGIITTTYLYNYNDHISSKTKINKVNKTTCDKETELHIDRYIDFYYKYKSFNWNMLLCNPHSFIIECMSYIDINYFNEICPCCLKTNNMNIDITNNINKYNIMCCNSYECRIKWTENKYYPPFYYEYQLSPNKVEVLMNILYYGLYLDNDKERVAENFSPFPRAFKNKEEHSYDYIENSFSTFISLDSINDLCSMYDLNRMKEAFYTLDLIYGQMYDTFEWLISSTYSHIKEIKDILQINKIYNIWNVPYEHTYFKKKRR